MQRLRVVARRRRADFPGSVGNGFRTGECILCVALILPERPGGKKEEHTGQKESSKLIFLLKDRGKTKESEREREDTFAVEKCLCAFIGARGRSLCYTDVLNNPLAHTCTSASTTLPLWGKSWGRISSSIASDVDHLRFLSTRRVTEKWRCLFFFFLSLTWLRDWIW